MTAAFDKQYPPEIERHGHEVRAAYDKMIADGQTEQWAIMCALQSPPGTKGSDRAFMEGRNNMEWMNNMPPHQAARMVREAAASGINTSGKFYMGGIADKRGHRDPEAWVGSVDDVKHVAKRRNLEVHGSVEYVPPQKDSRKKKVDIAPDILDAQVKAERKKNPHLSLGDATEKVKDKIVPRWKRKKK